MVTTTAAGSRKARRREERRAKKKRKLQHSEERGPVEKSKKETRSDKTSSKKSQNNDEGFSAQKRNRESDPYAHLDLEVAAAMRCDDAEIAELEHKLGMGSKKERDRLHREYAKLEGYGEDFGMFLDDLDGLMDRLNNDSFKAANNDQKLALEVSSETTSVDEEAVPMKDLTENDTWPEEDSDCDSEFGHFDKPDRSHVVESASGEEEDSDPLSSDDEPDQSDGDTYRPTEGEDIYGNQLDGLPTNTLPTKYVPPHLREQQERGSDEARKESLRLLQRALNNALNRLSEDTLISAAQSLANLYPSHPTSDVNDAIFKHLYDACISRPLVMSGMIPVYVACFAGVHIQTDDSVQLGGYLLERVVAELLQKLQSCHVPLKKNEVASTDAAHEEFSKEACNLVLVLSYLYSYNIAQCNILFEIIRKLIDRFLELDVECLLLILSHCGYSLRSDDPSSLKEIVLLVQERALRGGGGANSSRVKYMVSAMTDLKNNKKRRLDSAVAEKTAKLRKLLGRIKSASAASGRPRSSDSCLRITLDDILNVESKGRWWKVGASWVGNQFKHCAGGDEKANETEKTLSTSNPRKDQHAEEDEELLKLASKYRMNSDTRRSIFCIIMGSSDYEDAFEKLVGAGTLKNRTERDTVRVLFECCGNEKSFNQFYSHLAARICEYQPQCKFTFQLAFWDTFKQFEKLKSRKAANLAKLLFHLVVTNRCMKLNVLKVIDMSPDALSDSALIFLTIFFASIFETFDNPGDVYQLFSKGLLSGVENNESNKVREENADQGADSEGLRASLTIFFLQTLKSSPKNKKKSKFRANYKAALKACETDDPGSTI